MHCKWGLPASWAISCSPLISVPESDVTAPRDVDLDAQRGGSSRSIPLGRRRHPFDSQRQPADRDRALAWSVSCGRALSGLFWQSVVYGYYWQGIA